MAIFRFFQDGGCPPSWIDYVCVRATHEGHLMVFIAVQNLVGIDAVVLIMRVFRFHEIGLKTPHRPEYNSQKQVPKTFKSFKIFHGKVWESITQPDSEVMLSVGQQYGTVCNPAANTRNLLKFTGVPQTPEPVSAASAPKFALL